MKKISLFFMVLLLSLVFVSCDFFAEDPPVWYDGEFSEAETLNMTQDEVFNGEVTQPSSLTIASWSADLMANGDNYTYTLTTKSANNQTIGKTEYRFVSNNDCHWKITDSLGNVIYDDPLGITNKDDYLVIELDYGKTYNIKITHGGYNGTYQVDVFAPNGTYIVPSSASNSTVIVQDNFRYTNQLNTYQYTPNKSGEYSFTSSLEAIWNIKDSNGNKIYEPGFLSKKETSIKVNLSSGMTYFIQLEQGDTLGEFEFRIYRPSSNNFTFEEGTNKLRINDYLYTAKEQKTYTFVATSTQLEIRTSAYVSEWIVKDHLGNDHFKSGNYYYYSSQETHYHVTIKNLVVGQTYTLILPFNSEVGNITVSVRSH